MAEAFSILKDLNIYPKLFLLSFAFVLILILLYFFSRHFAFLPHTLYYSQNKKVFCRNLSKTNFSV